jgi:hypothetical protein
MTQEHEFNDGVSIIQAMLRRIILSIMYKQLGINLEASSFYESTTQALIGKAK